MCNSINIKTKTKTKIETSILNRLEICSARRCYRSTKAFIKNMSKQFLLFCTNQFEYVAYMFIQFDFFYIYSYIHYSCDIFCFTFHILTIIMFGFMSSFSEILSSINILKKRHCSDF